MKPPPLRAVTGDEIETFRRDGVVKLSGFFDSRWIDQLRLLADEDMNTPGAMKYELAEKGDPGRFFNNTFIWPRHDGFREVVFHSPAAALAGQVMEAEKINILFDQLLIKEPRTRQKTVWHQDLPYWPVLGTKVCTLWLALDPVNRTTGAMEFVRASHKPQQRYSPIAFRPEIDYHTPLPPVPDIEAERSDWDIISYDLEPGDCTLHSGFLLHAAGGNRSETQRRRAYLCRFAGEDVVYDPRPGIQPMLYDPPISPGDPLDCSLWPEVWTEANSEAG